MSGIYHKNKEWANVTEINKAGATATDTLKKVTVNGTTYAVESVYAKISSLANHATVPLDNTTLKIGSDGSDSAVYSTCTKSTYYPSTSTLSLATKTAYDATQLQDVFIPKVDIAEKTDTAPYLYRPSVANGDRVNEEYVGASVGWNQLAPTLDSWSANVSTLSYNSSTKVLTITPTNYGSDYTGTFKSNTLAVGHKNLVIADVNPTNGVTIAYGQGSATKYVDGGKWTTISAVIQPTSATCVFYGRVNTSGWSSGTIQLRNVMVFDLTVLLGATIADYAYTLETQTAGSGIAWLKSYGFFTKSYYPYNTGELLSVEVSGKKYVGKNLLPLTLAKIKAVNTAGTWSDNVYTHNGIKFAFTENGITASGTATSIAFLDLCGAFSGFLKDGDYKINSGTLTNCVLQISLVSTLSGVANVPSNGNDLSYSFNASNQDVRLVYRVNNGVTVNSQTAYPMIRRADVTDATYEPYHLTTYTFPSQTLRGLFTLVNDELKALGDVYRKDGTLERNFKESTFDNVTVSQNNSGTNAYEVYVRFSDKKAGYNNFVLPRFPYMGNSFTDVAEYSSRGYVTSGASAGDVAIKFPKSVVSTTAAAKQWLIDNGISITYERATPTTEQAEPLVMPQICDKNGTEEFITDSIVPVGHESTYYNYPDYMEEGEYKDFRDRVDYAPEKAKWHQVGIYAIGDTITIDGYYNEIMLVPNHYSGTTLLACASPAIFPFSLFKSITLQNSTESERIDITPAGVVGVTGTYFSNVTIFVR